MFAAIPAFVVAAAAATHEEKSGGLPQLNPADFSPQLVWLALTFIALYFILARVALPRIARSGPLSVEPDVIGPDLAHTLAALGARPSLRRSA